MKRQRAIATLSYPRYTCLSGALTMTKHPVFFVFFLFYTYSFFGLVLGLIPALFTFILVKILTLHPDYLRDQIWD